MPDVSINFRASDIAYAEQSLAAIPNGAKIAIRSAINDTLKSDRPEIVKEIRSEENVSSDEARSRVTIVDRPSAYSLSGALAVDYHPVKADDLIPRPRSTKAGGLSFVALKRKGTLKFPHGFKAPFSTGHIGAVVRSGPKRPPTKGKYAGRTLKRGPRKGQLMLRQPVVSVMAPAVVAVFEQFPEKLDSVAAGTAEKFHVRLMSKIDWILDRGNVNFPSSR